MKRIFSIIKNIVTRQYRSASLIIVLLACIVFLVPTHAHAYFHGTIGKLAGGFIDVGVDIIAKILAFVATMISGLILAVGMPLASGIFSLVLDLNFVVADTPIVAQGWAYTRGIVNAMFVLVLLVISFATMLRIQGYRMKDILWKLIVAAVLVNFSLTIAVAVIGFGNTLTAWFYNNANLGDIGWDMAQQFGISFDAQKLVFDVDANGLAEQSSEALNFFLTTIATAIYQIVFSLMLVAIIFAMAFLFLVRYIALVFLLILAPMAWLFWTIPRLSGMATRWWNSFLRWVFFAPAALFFIALSVSLASGSNSAFIQNRVQDQASSPAADDVITGVENNLLANNPVQNGVQMLVISGLLLGSLIVADKLSIHGARGAQRLVKATTYGFAGDVGKGAARGLGGRIRSRAATSGIAQKAAEKTADLAARVPFPGTNRASTAISGIAGSSQKKEEKYWKDRLSKAGTQTQFDTLARSTSTPAQAVAAAHVGTRKNFLGKDSSLTKDDRLKLARLSSRSSDKESRSKFIQATPTLQHDAVREKDIEQELRTELGNENFEALSTEEKNSRIEKARLQKISGLVSSINSSEITNVQKDELNLENLDSSSDEYKKRAHATLGLRTGHLRHLAREGGELAETVKSSLDKLLEDYANDTIQLDDEQVRTLQRLTDYWNSLPENVGNKLTNAPEKNKGS